MTLPDTQGPALYLAIMVAALVEGEITFVAASILVGRGLLDPFGVMLAGATGASLGDQAYFYLLRGRLRRWLDRIPALARRRESLVRRVRRHEVPMVFAIRFAPGMRIAMTAACAYAGVPALRFSFWNAISSLCWATAILVLVAWAGPSFLPKLGISGWWSALVPAAVIVIVSTLIGRAERRQLDARPDEEPRP
ncbi:MAG: VTT domain-containing protein [Acidobacteriota bacterium]